MKKSPTSLHQAFSRQLVSALKVGRLFLSRFDSNKKHSDCGSPTPSCPSDCSTYFHLDGEPANCSEIQEAHGMPSWPPGGQAKTCPKCWCTYILLHKDIPLKQHHENCDIFQMNSPAIRSQYFQSSDLPSNVDLDSSNTNRVLCSMSVTFAQRSSSGSFTCRFLWGHLFFQPLDPIISIWTIASSGICNRIEKAWANTLSGANVWVIQLRCWCFQPQLFALHHDNATQEDDPHQMKTGSLFPGQNTNGYSSYCPGGKQAG